jgi:hypothetical protein
VNFAKANFAKANFDKAISGYDAIAYRPTVFKTKKMSALLAPLRVALRKAQRRECMHQCIDYFLYFTFFKFITIKLWKFSL